MYSIKWFEGNVKTCKGISKMVNKVVLRHEMYKECLMNVELRKYKVSRIGSELHQIYTYNFSKISLSSFDDKRYVLDDKINTLAYGHYGRNITKKQLYEWLSKQDVYTSHHPTIHLFARRVVTRG